MPAEVPLLSIDITGCAVGGTPVLGRVSLTLTRGETVALTGPSGVGKSTLLATLAKSMQADAVVVALVGERGREVNEFVEHALGAEGMNMGTRFIATQEAPVHENVKQAILAASERDTSLVMRPLRNTERVLNNSAVAKVLELEKEKGADLTFADIAPMVAQVYPKVMRQGEMEAGVWSCGMVAGLINDIPTCEELISRIMREAEEMIRARLTGML